MQQNIIKRASALFIYQIIFTVAVVSVLSPLFWASANFMGFSIIGDIFVSFRFVDGTTLLTGATFSLFSSLIVLVLASTWSQLELFINVGCLLAIKTGALLTSSVRFADSTLAAGSTGFVGSIFEVIHFGDSGIIVVLLLFAGSPAFIDSLLLFMRSLLLTDIVLLLGSIVLVDSVNIADSEGGLMADGCDVVELWCCAVVCDVVWPLRPRGTYTCRSGLRSRCLWMNHKKWNFYCMFPAESMGWILKMLLTWMV